MTRYTMPMAKSEHSGHWWAPFAIPVHETAILSLGPLTLHLHRGADEWLIAWEREEGDSEPLRAGITLSPEPLQADNYQRYVTASTAGEVVVNPLLADRPVVVKPRQPVFILPGEETTLYLSTPIWAQVSAGDPRRALQEISVLRLSDSWFGPSTREGELCYAARTHARNSLDEIQRRPHRAITPVRIHNRADAQLPIEKLSLPVPLLSIYGDDEGTLWTESINLIRTADSDMAAMTIDAGAPRHAPDAALLTGPRQHVEKSGLVVRAFSGLFG